MTPWGLVNCKVFGLQGPSLTNRVSELFTHGSVGGVGRKPGPYPAATDPANGARRGCGISLPPEVRLRRQRQFPKGPLSIHPRCRGP